jgi:predicted house-cleaning NTP pyrophosphatase (Maf/HAM1 superfamily)
MERESSWKKINGSDFICINTAVKYITWKDKLWVTVQGRSLCFKPFSQRFLIKKLFKWK